jgi:hypothetical protein
MNYLVGIVFALVFGIGNVVKWIWDKHMRKVLLLWLGYTFLKLLYVSYTNPSIIANNLKDPLVIVAMGILLLVFFVIFGQFLLDMRRSRKFMKHIENSILESGRQTRLMNSKEIPSDKDIDKYYRMYLKKFELDNDEIWTTNDPMSFEQFYKEAKSESKQEGLLLSGYETSGWKFLISMTSDAFSFDPKTGQSTMWRYRDYESMV